MITILTSVTNALLLVVVLVFEQAKVRHHSVYVFALSIGSLIVWSLTNYLADTSTSVESGLFWTRASFPPSLAMCVSIFWFSRIFPDASAQYSRLLQVYAGLCFVCSVFVLTSDTMISQVGIDPRIGISDVVVGDAYIGVVLLYLLLIAHTTINLVRNVRRYTGKKRTQVSYVLLGWSLFLVSAVMTNAVLPLITGNANWSKFGPVTSIFMVGCIVYVIVRHEFLDIKVIIQRGIIYSVLLTILVGIYLTLIFLTRSFFVFNSEHTVVLSAFVTTLVGVFGTPRLIVYFKRVTNPWFFKHPYDYEDVMQQLAIVLSDYLDRERIMHETKNILMKSLNLSDIAFEIPSGNTVPLETYVLRFPIMNTKRKIADLVVGEKLSEDIFTQTDIHLLETFSAQAGVALEKARLYEEVEAYARTLEARVESRTKEIKMLQQEQEDMMLEISHGLQTPLTIMKGELFIMRKQGYEPEKLQSIDASINRISQFIARVLKLFAHSEKEVRIREVHDLKDIIESVCFSCQGIAKLHGAHLTVEAAESVLVAGVRDELEELVSNLVENAIKYSDPNRVNTIVVSLVNDNGAIVRIIDTGVGIKSEHIPHVFERFYRIADGVPVRPQGTGLGLAICKKIVTDHKGDIGIESVFGVGTTFSIRLPIYKDGIGSA